MVQAIVFDFFDVIHSDPFNRWLKKYGYKREGKLEESSRLADIGHISEEEFYKRLSLHSGQSLESVKAVFGNVNLVDKELVKFIAGLHRNYKIGLLSNSTSEYLRPILEIHNLMPLFDEIVISAEIGLLKPDAKIFNHILRKLQVKPQNAIFIDDNPRNVDAARAMGMPAVIYTDMDTLRHQLEGLGLAVPN
jgi:putative hydrolase of the HAD superfamily